MNTPGHTQCSTQCPAGSKYSAHFKRYYIIGENKENIHALQADQTDLKSEAISLLSEWSSLNDFIPDS